MKTWFFDFYVTISGSGWVVVCFGGEIRFSEAFEFMILCQKLDMKFHLLTLPPHAMSQALLVAEHGLWNNVNAKMVHCKLYLDGRRYCGRLRKMPSTS